MENIKFDFFEKVINNVNIEILEHGLFSGDTSWRHYGVSSPFSRLYFMLDGEAYIEDDRGRIPLKAGNIYLIPPHTNYGYICDQGFRQFYVHLRVELFVGFDVFSALDACLSKQFDPVIVERFLDKIQSTKIGDMIFCKGFILDAVSQLLEPVWQGLEEKADSAYKYRDIYRYIRENCGAELTVEKISRNLNLTPSSLVKSFKRHTGQTLKSCIDNAVMQAAKEKILLTDMNIKEIAYSLKFSDEFYFSRYFKKHSRLSPKEYRIKNKIQ